MKSYTIFHNNPIQYPIFFPLYVKLFLGSWIVSMDKNNHMVFLIGHHSYLFSLSHQAQDSDSQSKVSHETAEVSVSNCHCQPPLSFQNLFHLFSSEVKIPLPLPVHHGLIRSKRSGDTQGNPEFTSTTDCWHDRLHVSYAKEEREEQSHGCLLHRQQTDTVWGHGTGKLGHGERWSETSKLRVSKVQILTSAF